MNKLLVTTMTIIGLCSPAFAEEVAPPPPEAAVSAPSARTNRFGVQVTFAEDDHQAYGLTYEHDFSRRSRVFFQAEMYSSEDTAHMSAYDYYQTEITKTKGMEFELGYLRRLSDPTHQFGFYLGPSIAVQLDEGELNGTRDYYDGDIGTAHADIDPDPGINVYANAMADYTFRCGFGLFTMFSFGYQFERDVTYEYAAGAVDEYTSEGDTFWNLSLGVFFSF